MAEEENNNTSSEEEEEKMSSLQRMLTSISQERTKDRLAISADGEFQIVTITDFWSSLFIEYFQNGSMSPDDSRDDMLFYVRKTNNLKGKFEFKQSDVDVHRRDSKKLPVFDDKTIDWEETVYLNIILHQFEYVVTCAVCTRTGEKELQILKKFSQRVYPSPSKRRMDSKGTEEELAYPNIFFSVDNFEDAFIDIVVRDSEMVCVELIASDRDGKFQGVIFLGSIRYEALKKVYDSRSEILHHLQTHVKINKSQVASFSMMELGVQSIQSCLKELPEGALSDKIELIEFLVAPCEKLASMTSRMAQRMGFVKGHRRVEYMRMRGPQGKGHAEMAVSRVRGSGPETPDMENFPVEDFEADEETNEYTLRRMSDPSSAISTFVRGGIRRAISMKKSHSANENVDMSGSEDCNEVEAGTLSDELRDTDQYNGFWGKSFGQAWHWFKERKRANSVALHSHLTYITLPWYRIIAGLLREEARVPRENHRAVTSTCQLSNIRTLNCGTVGDTTGGSPIARDVLEVRQKPVLKF